MSRIISNVLKNLRISKKSLSSYLPCEATLWRRAQALSQNFQPDLQAKASAVWGGVESILQPVQKSMLTQRYKQVMQSCQNGWRHRFVDRHGGDGKNPMTEPKGNIGPESLGGLLMVKQSRHQVGQEDMNQCFLVPALPPKTQSQVKKKHKKQKTVFRFSPKKCKSMLMSEDDSEYLEMLTQRSDTYCLSRVTTGLPLVNGEQMCRRGE